MTITTSLDLSAYELTVEEFFQPPTLNRNLWVDHYLPHWTTPDRSVARYELTDHGLALRIDAEQPAWLPEDGPMRVSNLQTGAFCGPLGSPVGQHRHRDGLTVVTPYPEHRGWTPSEGIVEVVASAPADPTMMLGIWCVGVEESPEQAGELCLAELFGNVIGQNGSRVRLGIKAHHDPALTSEVLDVDLPMDATQPNAYAVQWSADGARFFVNGNEVHRTDQTLRYPVQLMVDLFEFPTEDHREPAGYPKVGHIHCVRGYEPRRII